VQKEFGDLPGVAVEDVKAMLDAGQPVQIIDARPQSYIARQQDIMDGAVWRDPERINDWIGDCRNQTRSWCSARTDSTSDARRPARSARPASMPST
jgi:hypothetical protein